MCSQCANFSLDPPEVILLFHIFVSIEILVHFIAIIFSFTFIYVLSQIHSLHSNLRLILTSFIVSFAITAVFRLQISFSILLFNKDYSDEDLWKWMSLRDVGMFAAALHMQLIAIERLYATRNARNYIGKDYAYIIFAIILFLWLISFAVMFTTVRSATSSLLIAAVYFIVDVIAISTMIYVRKVSMGIWRKYRGTLPMDHAYQNRENAITSLFLYKCFVWFAAQSFIGIASFVGYVVFRAILAYPLYSRCFGFIFDISIAGAPITIITVIYRFVPKVNSKMKEILGKLRRRNTNPRKKTPVILDLEGKKLNVKHCDETNEYFNQFKAAWS